MVKVLVPIHQGFEEIEFISIVDILRRAGAEVVVASVHEEKMVKGCNSIVVKADELFEEVKDLDFDLVVSPGGMENAKGLAKMKEVVERFRRQKVEGKWYGAICATPKILFEPNGLLEGVKATSFPSVNLELSGEYLQKGNVVVSKNCITSQSPGTAAEFALTIVQHLISKEKAAEIAEETQFYSSENK